MPKSITPEETNLRRFEAAAPSPHCDIIQLERLPNGDFVNWGRHGPNGAGGAVYYRGEAARVLELVIKHSSTGTTS
jgi:hypothetical protein